MTTSTLLDALRSFQDDAWSRFAERFRGPVVGFGRRLGLAEAEAEDLAQETLLAFADAHRAGRFDPERGRLSSWLFGIAWRQAQRLRADRERADPPASTGYLEQLPEGEASVDWDREWEAALMARCLERARRETSEASWSAFELTVLQGLAAEEAARRLEVGVKSVYNAKHRVLRRVRQLREDLER